jgi:hypothetical protein
VTSWRGYFWGLGVIVLRRKKFLSGWAGSERALNSALSVIEVFFGGGGGGGGSLLRAF